MEIFSKLRNKINNVIKTAYVSLINDDSSSYPTAQASYKGKTAEFIRLSPYGLDSNPPNGSFVLLMSANGDPSSKFGLCNSPLTRFRQLGEGEVALFNVLTGSIVLMDQNGDINISASGNVNITASNVTVTGSSSVSINGTDWQSHQHSGVTPGGSNTGGVV